MEPSSSAGHPQLPDAGSGRRVAVPAAQAVNALRWRQVLRGEERQLRRLRRWLASVLPDCPARDDVISVATELASNALRHTASGHGGWFAVEITRYRAAVRVLVADQGGPAEPRVIDDPDGESGRGLLLVSGLSTRTGVAGDQRGRLVWAEVAFDAPDTFGEVSAHDPYETAIRDGQTALARRFRDVPAWFGRSTLAWWALSGSGELVATPSVPELASLLDRPRSHVPHAAAAGDGPGRAVAERAQRDDAGRRPAPGTQRGYQPGGGHTGVARTVRAARGAGAVPLPRGHARIWSRPG
jgi:anti-sigma regulatory factor (Ser/Thr protein kinase)